MTFESSKTIGGIGALLLLIGALPYVSSFSYGILALVGAIMVLVALHGLGQHYQDGRIFRNAIIGIVAGIIGVIAAVGTFVAYIIINMNSIRAFITQIYPGWNGDWTALQNMTPDTNAFTSGNFDYSALIPFLVAIIAAVAIIWIFAIVATFFIRRSLTNVREKSDVGLFGTAGMLMLIGAFLIIIGIGVILIWIGVLLLAIAFFQLRPAPAVVSAPPPPTTV